MRNAVGAAGSDAAGSDAAASPHDPLALLQSFYDAEMRYVAAGGAKAGADFAEVAAHLHPQAVLRQGPSVPYPGDWVGVDGFERFFEVFAETWESLDLSEVTYFVGEQGVAISLRMRAAARATGRRVDTRCGQFITFDGGRIRDFAILYADPVGVADATRTD